MAFRDLPRLKSLLRCPDTLRRVYWWGSRGYALGSKRRIVQERSAFVFVSHDLPANYDQPDYASSNPYQQRSLELIDEYADGLVVDLGAGNPQHSFPNVCQVEIRKYPGTDIVVTEGRVPLAENSVDAVISEAVLEHVQNPFVYVSEILRILKPGGKVLLDTAFMQPLHGFPYHFFNTTAYAVRLLFEPFEIERLHVGPHQHPWIALNWLLNSYYNGLADDEARRRFRSLSLGEAMDLLNEHQRQRTEIKQHPDPRAVAAQLKTFNDDHRASLAPFLEITDACQDEIAAGFQVFAKKAT